MKVLFCEILGLYSDIHGYVGLTYRMYAPGTVIAPLFFAAIAVGTELLLALSRITCGICRLFSS